MANTRSASIGVAERLQKKKLELETLINRQPIIHHPMEDALLFSELQSQLKHMLKKSEKTMRALHKQITDNLDVDAMEALEDEINSTLFLLKNEEERDIEAAYQTSQHIVKLQNELKAASDVTKPIAAEAETPAAAPASPTQAQPDLMTTARKMVYNLFGPTTATPPSPKKIPPTSKKTISPLTR